MNRVKLFIQNLVFTESSAPITFFVLCFLSFGLFIPSLGFYMDDWPYVFYAKLKGIESLQEMLTYDSRPNAAWLYIIGFKLLGFNPLAWHVFAFLMRFASVITFWWFLRLMWRERSKEAIYISLLFAIYPFFMLQPFAVGSTHHWFGFLSFNSSLILMVYAIQTKTNSYKKWAFIVAALVLEAAHLFTSEYFAGLELIRIVIIWILVARTQPAFSKRSWSSTINWLPYLIVLGIFIYWRAILYVNPEGVIRNEPVILKQLMTAPFNAIAFLATASITDFISVLTLGWQRATDVSLVNFASPFFQFKVFICVASLFLLIFYFRKLNTGSEEINKENWHKNSFTLAITALLTGGLPIWLVGRSIVESKNLLSASRFGIPAMFGAAILTFLLIDYFITDNNKKNIFIAFLLALAINFHLDNTKDFQYSWEKQERFAQQLLWRAPGIEPGTALLTDQEIMGIMGEYAVSFSINTTYQVTNFGNKPPYWYFPFYYTNPNINDLLQGVPLEYEKLSMEFSGNSKQMLLLDFNPEQKRCLWILQPQDTNLRLVSDDVRKLAAGSDISLIKKATEEVSLPQDIYGKQNNQTWCYYFEKADLARQYQQWDEIVRLWDEAKSIGERADNGFEYIPFIEGFGHAEDWEQVKSLTKLANRVTEGLEPSLCSALDRLAASAPDTQASNDTIKNLKDDLQCENYQ